MPSIERARATATVEVDLSRRHISLCSSAEWLSVCTAHHNALLEGPAASTDAALLLLTPHLPENAEWKRPGAPLELPANDVGALILQDVGGLGAEEQTRLLMWLATASQQTQIVSTTAHSLFALVVRGLFDEALYYHLNVVLLQIDFSDRREPRASNPYPD
jgi:hypothetical protein